MSVWTSFWHLVWRSLVYFPSELSGNWLSVSLPVGVYFIRECFRARKSGWRSMTWKNIERDTWIMVVAYAALFSWAVIHTVYRDHVKLMAKNAALKQQLAKSKVANLSMHIKGWIDNQDENHNAIVQVWLGVDNSGEPDTLSDWSLDVKTGHIIREGSHSIGQGALKSSLNLPFLDIEFQRPVGIVADMEGYVTFGLHGMNQQQFNSLYLDHSAVLIVSAVDSKGRQITAEKNIYQTWLEGNENRPAR